uniref:DNA helicase n=1 Tax=Tanacetum cinerariifolium TaxID=118510 RepID=A0A6L2JC98_TANCI|nr:DNA helicase [Tanacetum cinerariifolium]
MCLLQPKLSEDEKNTVKSFATWLLKIGEGKVREVEENTSGSSCWITIPEEYCMPNDDRGLANLIRFIYDADTLQTLIAQDLQQKAIVCPRNNTSDVINGKILEMINGKSTIYTSSDEAIPAGSDRGEVELLYPPEFLNTLQFSGKEHDRMMLNSIEHGLLVYVTIEVNGVTRTKTYEELTNTEKIQDDCDVRATNIILQGLLSKLYSLVNHHEVSKETWDRVKLLMKGTKLSQQECECKLYDDFDRFTLVKGESLHEYYLRFAQLMNDMHTIGMTMKQVQVNTKFLNTLSPE